METKLLLDDKKDKYTYTKYPKCDLFLFVLTLIPVIVTSVQLSKMEINISLILKFALCVVVTYFTSGCIWLTMRTYLLLEWAQISKEDYEKLLAILYNCWIKKKKLQL